MNKIYQMYKKIVILVITLIIIFFGGGWYMHKSQQQMATLVISDSENALDYPNKRKWFDASRWLSRDYCNITLCNSGCDKEISRVIKIKPDG